MLASKAFPRSCKCLRFCSTFILQSVIFLLLWSSFSGAHEGPEYQIQSEKHFEHFTTNMNKARKEPVFPLDDINSRRENLRNELTPDSVASKKPKVRKKEIDNSVSSSGLSIPSSQEVIANFCEMVEDFCGRVENPDDVDGGDWLSIPLNDVKDLVNEITSVRSKRILHEVPMGTVTRLLHVIDRQIQCSQGLSIDAKENVSYLPYH